MRIAVLGPTGMMGHAACRVLSARHEVFGIARSDWPEGRALGAHVPRERWVKDADGLRPESLGAALAKVRAEAVLNCIGIVKQLEAANDPILSLEMNALLPHRLALYCRLAGARLVQLSTDCVFSGRKGMYTEADNPDPVDLYGRTKLLGEVSGPGVLTLRTSIIGRQLAGQTGLVEWFRTRRGQSAKGYARAIYTGFTTDALTAIIEETLIGHPDLSGVWHVASSSITKHDLLMKLNARWNLGVKVEKDEQFVCDRSLDGSRFSRATGIRVPDWDEMIAALDA